MFKNYITTVTSDQYAPISEDLGLVNKHIVTKLPQEYKIWDELANDLADNIACFQIKDILAKMPCLPANAVNLPDQYLLRASIILSGFAHGYYYPDGYQEGNPLPDSVLKPLLEIAARINKKFTVDGKEELYVGRTYLEDFLANWEFSDDTDNAEPVNLEKIQLNKLKLLVSYFKLPDDNIGSFVTGPLMQAKFAPAIKLIGQLESVLDLPQPSVKVIAEILEEIKKILVETEKVFQLINPKLQSATYVDQILWPQTSPIIGKISHPHEKPNTGADSPIFHIMDMLINRIDYQSDMGKNILDRFTAVPENFQKLILNTKVVGEKLFAFIAQHNDKTLRANFVSLVNSYTGVGGLLDKHRKKAFGYIIMSFIAGRLATNANVQGKAGAANSNAVLPWEGLNKAWIAGMNDRLQVLKRLGIAYATLEKQMATGEMPHNGKKIKAYDVALANEPRRNWAIYQNGVYDIQPIAVLHPGGHRLIRAVAGTDMTKTLEQAHLFNINMTRSLLNKYYLGNIENNIDSNNTLQNLVDDWTNKLFLASSLQNNLRNIWFFDKATVGDAQRQVPFQFVKKALNVLLGQEGYFDLLLQNIDPKLSEHYRIKTLYNIADPRQITKQPQLPLINLGKLAMELAVVEIRGKELKKSEETEVAHLIISKFYEAIIFKGLDFIDSLKQKIVVILRTIDALSIADMSSEEIQTKAIEYDNQLKILVEQELNSFIESIDTTANQAHLKNCIPPAHVSEYILPLGLTLTAAGIGAFLVLNKYVECGWAKVLPPAAALATGVAVGMRFFGGVSSDKKKQQALLSEQCQAEQSMAFCPFATRPKASH